MLHTRLVRFGLTNLAEDPELIEFMEHDEVSNSRFGASVGLERGMTQLVYATGSDAGYLAAATPTLFSPIFGTLGRPKAGTGAPLHC